MDLDPYGSVYGRFSASPARTALKNSQLTCGGRRLYMRDGTLRFADLISRCRCDWSGTRSRAIRLSRTSKESANGKTGRERASAPIAQVRVRRSSKKKRRDVQRRTRGSASLRRRGAARCYYFYAHQRFNSISILRVAALLLGKRN